MLLQSIKKLDGKQVTQNKLDRLYGNSNFVAYFKGKEDIHHFVFMNDVQIAVKCNGSVAI